MKTRVTETSLNALSEVESNLGRMQQIVFDCVKNHLGVTAKQISYYTGLKINVVTGRVNELMHMQLIKISGISEHRKSNLYSVRQSWDPRNQFDLSWEEKYNSLKSKYENVVRNARLQGFDIEQLNLF